MLPWAIPNTTNVRQPAPLTPPWAIVFHDPVTTPNVTRTATATSATRWIGNRSASTAALGRTAVSTDPPLCSVMSTSGTGLPALARPSCRCLVAAEHRVRADRKIGLPAAPLQISPGELHVSPAAHLDPVGVPLRHGQRVAELAVVVPSPQGLLVEDAVPERRRPDRRPGLVAHDHRCAGIDRKSTRLNSSHVRSSYAVFCLKKNTIAGFFLTSFSTAWRHSDRPS